MSEKVPVTFALELPRDYTERHLKPSSGLSRRKTWGQQGGFSLSSWIWLFCLRISHCLLKLKEALLPLKIHNSVLYMLALPF